MEAENPKGGYKISARRGAAPTGQQHQGLYSNGTAQGPSQYIKFYLTLFQWASIG